MRIKTLFLVIAFGIIFSFSIVNQGFCYRLPTEESNIEYLYVFGPDGDSNRGALKEPQVVFLKVPDTYKGKIQVSIFDPVVGSSLDEEVGKAWDTETKFSVLGGNGAFSSMENWRVFQKIDCYKGVILAEKTFGYDKEYDKKVYSFDPIDVEKGEKIGSNWYFKIVAEGVKGDDNNIYAIEILPDEAEAFAFLSSIRLADKKDAKMYLYPQVPAGANWITERNYNLGSTGGMIEFISPSKEYRVKGSSSGEWANTQIRVSNSDAGQRWGYEITKGRRPNADMAVTICDEDCHPVTIYFKQGERHIKITPVVKLKEAPMVSKPLSCNTFTFDGSKSYAANDKEKLTYFWDFGDGTTSTEMRTMHTYKDPGKYLVKLTVKDASDAKCNTAATRQVVKVNQPPCAVADGPKAACVDEEFTFDGSQSTTLPDNKLTYRWDFGDGQTADGVKVKHKYVKGGNYQATLTVTDDSGTICDTGIDKLKVAVNTAPIAVAGKDVFLCKLNPNEPLEVTFDGSGSKDADGDALSYSWDFGDGQTAEGKVVKHTYEKGGEYIAKLVVTDNTDTKCNKAIATKKVMLNRAPVAKAGANIKICVEEKANLDASKSFDADGDPLSYAWDFGDGEKGEGKIISHQYAKGGVYQVKLAVDDGTKTDCSSSIDKISVIVNSRPKAVISSKDTASINQVVNFDGSLSNDSDGDKLLYTWDFGDGTTSSNVSAKHSYSKGGLYKVTLVVDDNKGTDCSSVTESHYIKVNTPPVADAGPNMTVCVNEEVQFDGSKSYDLDTGDKLTYKWDFGDGETAEGVKVKHAYKKLGIYKVTLTVTDDSGVEGNLSLSSLTVTVHEEPVSKIVIE